MEGYVIGGLILLAAAVAKPPVIDVVPVSNDEVIGDWTITTLGDGTALTSTKNSVGAFGSFCTKSGCSAFVNPSIKCDDGHEYPILVNAPVAAFNLVVKCAKMGSYFVYTMPIEGAVAEAESVGGVIGFAFPMASGEFKVARFSLTGAARATARAQQIVQAPDPKRPIQASDNYSL